MDTIKNEGWKVRTNRYVAFLDILGFKDYVLRHSINDVYKRLQTLNELCPEENDPNDDEKGYVKTSIFSDSIYIFSKDDTRASLIHFITIVKRTMRMALRKKIPLKGAIAYGEIVVDLDSQIFCGQPIIDAFLLEEDLQYMGVVFHHTFEEPFSKSKNYGPLVLRKCIYEIDTPFKFGNRIHLNLDYRMVGSRTAPGYEKFVEEQRCYSSGDARKYVDNTLRVMKLFSSKDTI